MIALTDRLRRLQETHAALKQSHEEALERLAVREPHGRAAVHELRDAAHTFLSWSFVLRRSELKDTPWFAPLVRAAEAVLRRAEEVLESDDSDAPPAPGARVDLVATVRDALETIRPVADAAGIDLSCAIAPGRTSLPAVADPDRVQQILQTLLRNALAATPRGGGICVSAWDFGGVPAVEVEDTGPGVPPEILRLFAGDEAHPDQDAPTGLRLARALAGRMGGSLDVAPSRPGAGARFVLRLRPADE